jgi:hypothetical protein
LILLRLRRNVCNDIGAGVWVDAHPPQITQAG